MGAKKAKRSPLRARSSRSALCQYICGQAESNSPPSSLSPSAQAAVGAWRAGLGAESTRTPPPPGSFLPSLSPLGKLRLPAALFPVVFCSGEPRRGCGGGTGACPSSLTPSGISWVPLGCPGRCRSHPCPRPPLGRAGGRMRERGELCSPSQGLAAKDAASILCPPLHLSGGCAACHPPRENWGGGFGCLACRGRARLEGRGGSALGGLERCEELPGGARHWSSHDLRFGWCWAAIQGAAPVPGGWRRWKGGNLQRGAGAGAPHPALTGSGVTAATRQAQTAWVSTLGPRAGVLNAQTGIFLKKNLPLVPLEGMFSHG